MALADKMSDYLENELTDHWLAGNSYTSPANVYLALGEVAANETDETSWSDEFTGTGYQRQELSFHKAQGWINESVISFIDEQVEFTAGGNWGTAKYFTIWDAQTGGKLLFRGKLREEVDMTSSGKKLTIPKSQLAVTFKSSTYSIYLRRMLLNHVLRNEAYPIPDKYVALTFTRPRADQSGSELTEPAGSGYARVLVDSNDWTVAGNEGKNDLNIDFPTATSDYEDLIRVAAIADANKSTGGNLLVFSVIELPTGGVGSQPPGHEILDTDSPRINSEDVEIYLR